ncbi:MAG TPA: hypothetical protein VKC51_03555 [Lacunisphaera sp.]|nr:hypothetical protein [Lacunisphaera sp.]
MRTLKEITEVIGKLSDTELTELCAWLSARDESLEITDAFEAKMKDSERQMREGQRPRTR